MSIQAGIIGGAGYTGGELIRLLNNHPHVSLGLIHSRSQAGKLLSSVHHDLIGDSNLQFTDNSEALADGSIDVLFLCAGHGEARKFLAENHISPSTKLVDLSHDFRLAGKHVFEDRHFVYGLPELNREAIVGASNVANPGCFATAIQLGLLPLAEAGLVNDVYTTGVTGSTGAGQGLSPTSHFSWRAANIQPYKTLSHQHLGEIYQSIHQLQPGFPAAPGTEEEQGINFVPWRGDFTRGIFISSMITCSLKADALRTLYDDYYADHPFTIHSHEEIFLKQVVNTNKCVIYLEKVGSKLVVHSVIDNLLKGASGQAVQNMNLMFGLDECAGLRLKASAF
ncbi:MAG TPA: N-acetyl-gamma-glutamyl-phosphate reductase [Flavisolibacter sp.]|nr:N-acetyl-gamma-glutamyl-phosphate reductase [Flavisolibacter sp.]